MNVMLAQSAHAEIQPYLEPDEELLWSGAPRHGLVLRSSDIFMIPFSVLWGGFAIFWEVAVISSGASIWFVVWGVPFVVIGLYMMIGRFFLDDLMRRKTSYAVTDRRIVIVSGIRQRQIKSLDLRTLTDVSLTELSRGEGNVTFGPVAPWGWWAPPGAWPGMQQSPMFELIPEAWGVYNLIRNAQRDALFASR
jgi:hypothetical protein